jgi:hypothetical protein
VTLLLRGIMEGDWADDRGREIAASSCVWVGGVFGMGGAGGIIDMRFILRASVGLIVRAPRPVAWGIMDIRLLAEDDGVLPAPTAFFTGVRRAFVEEDLECSSPPDGIKRFS